MKVFHRFKHTVTAGFESLLDQVENQEAVVAASIREVEQGAGRVRVHRKRCERRIEQLEQRLAALDIESKAWRERAVRFGDDREKALECVRRLRTAEQARAGHAAELAQQRGLREKVSLDEQAIEARLSELRTRAASLSSREARSSAQAGAYDPTNLDAVFDRWEARLDGIAAYDTAPPIDTFASALTREEDEAATLAELERILAAAKGEGSS
jgi:phage shock protein A